MDTKPCKKCGSTKSLRAFHKNGGGRYKPACKSCSRKIADLAKHKARAVKLWHQGKGLTEIGRAFGRDRRTVSYWLLSAGISTKKRSTESVNWARKGDPEALKPIGKADGEKWEEIDAAILRARLEAGLIDGRVRVRAEATFQSSLGGDLL